MAMPPVCARLGSACATPAPTTLCMLVLGAKAWQQLVGYTAFPNGSQSTQGFKMGGHLVFNMEFQANQRASKESISASLSVQGFWGSATASAEKQSEMRAASVNIKKRISSNTGLPPGPCSREWLVGRGARCCAKSCRNGVPPDW